MEAKKEGIPLSSLATTIQDAIFLARSLGFTYLWVDSLCIIQEGDPDDKLTELERMSSIYRNSALAIIIASASSATDGFLKSGSAVVPKVDLKLPFGIIGMEAGCIILRDKGALDGIDNLHDPTETRAWCLQEALLSKQCLVYSSLRCYWSCQQIAYADCNLLVPKLPAPEYIHHFVQNLPPIFESGLEKQPLTADQWNELWEFWVDVLADYTHRDITNPADRFRALAGIAAEVHKFTGDKYFAGLWERDIWKSLLWAVDFSGMLGQGTRYWRQLPFKTALNRRHLFPPLEYLAPTWSWAAVTGHVNHFRAPKSQYFEFVTAEVKHKKKEFSFGALEGASMKVKGRLEHAIWTKEVLASGGGHHWLTSIEHETIGGLAPSKVNHAWSHPVLGYLIPNQAANLPSFSMGNRTWFPPGSPWRSFLEKNSNNPPDFNRSSQSDPRSLQWGAAPPRGFSSFGQSPLGSRQESYSIDKLLPKEARAYPDTWESYWYESKRKVEEVYCLEVGHRTGLILKPVPAAPRGTFERVGFFMDETGGRWFATSPVEEVTLI